MTSNKRLFWGSYRSEESIQKIREYDRKRSKTPKRKISQRIKDTKYRKLKKNEMKEYQKNQRQKIRRIVISHYSENKNCCSCCGESIFQFLCIDHINGCGKKQRKEVGGGGTFYHWLIKNNFPKGFRVLCHNCNCSLGFYGFCPHTITSRNAL